MKRPEGMKDRSVSFSARWYKRGSCAAALFLAILSVPSLAQNRSSKGTAKDIASKLPPNWEIYVNDRYGQSVAYPRDVFTVRDPDPTNGDGARFHSADSKALFSISGSYNSFDPPLSVNGHGDPEQGGNSLQAFDEHAAKDNGWKVTYRTRGKNWVVISGTKGDRIFYEKTMLADSDRLELDLWIEYPAEQKRVYDKIVAQMASSLDWQAGSES